MPSGFTFASNQSHEKINYYCCKGRIRTSTGQLDARQRARAGGQPQSTLPLSCYPYPRDKRAWLPISSPHNLVIRYLLVVPQMPSIS
jgi:hypothetical protein